MQEIPVAVTFGFKIEDANTGETLAVRNEVVSLVLRLPVPEAADLEAARRLLVVLNSQVKRQLDLLDEEESRRTSAPASPSSGEATSSSSGTGVGDASSGSTSSSGSETAGTSDAGVQGPFFGPE